MDELKTDEKVSMEQDLPKKESRSVFSLRLGKKKGEPTQQTQMVVAGEQTTMVGKTIETREPEQTETQVSKIPEKVLFRWQAPEFVYTHKPVGWFVLVSVFFLILIVVATFLKQWFTIPLLIVMATAVIVWANRKPRVLEYIVTNYGVMINGKKYLFDDFKAFYTFLDYNQKTLDLIPAKKFGTLVSMPLVTPDSDEIQATIAKMVPQIEHREDPIDRLIRNLRF